MLGQARLKPASIAGTERLAGPDLLLHALEDEDVGVDGHADAEDERRHAGQRQRHADDPEDGVDHQRVEDERDRGEHARQAVVGDHEEEDEQQADAAGDERLDQEARRRASDRRSAQPAR